MRLNILLADESLTPTNDSLSVTASIISIEAHTQAKKPKASPRHSVDLDEFIAQLSDGDDEFVELLAKGRKRLVNDLYPNEGDTIRTLRLKNGWSQAQLAALMSTSQPHIARMEKQYTGQLTFDTCQRLSEVFGIDMNTLSLMLNHQNDIIRHAKSTKL